MLQLLLLLLRISPDALRSLLAILVQSDAHDEPITYHFLASILVLLGSPSARALCTLQSCSCPVATLELSSAIQSASLDSSSAQSSLYTAPCNLSHPATSVCFRCNDDLVPACASSQCSLQGCHLIDVAGSNLLHNALKVPQSVLASANPAASKP